MVIKWARSRVVLDVELWTDSVGDWEDWEDGKTWERMKEEASEASEKGIRGERMEEEEPLHATTKVVLN